MKDKQTWIIFTSADGLEKKQRWGNYRPPRIVRLLLLPIGMPLKEGGMPSIQPYPTRIYEYCGFHSQTKSRRYFEYSEILPCR